MNNLNQLESLFKITQTNAYLDFIIKVLLIVLLVLGNVYLVKLIRKK